MNLYGYDLLLRVDESLLNKALSALFYTGKLKKYGTYHYVKDVPAEFLGFTQVDYKIRLKNEPFLDFLGAADEFGEGKVGVRLSVELMLTVLSGVDVELDLDFGATAEIKLDYESKKFIYDLTSTNIYDIKINDILKFHKNVLERLDQIIKILLAHYITEDIKQIDLPLDLLKITLPTLPETPENHLPINHAEIAFIDNHSLVIGLDFFNNKNGQLEGIISTPPDTELNIGIKTDLLKAIASFWWERTDIAKTKTFEGSVPINIKRYFVNAAEFLARAVTLGFIEPDTEVKKAELIYKVTLELLKLPEFTFEDNGNILLENLELKTNIRAKIEGETRRIISLDTSGLIPDKLTPWEDDVKLTSKTKKATLIKIEEDLIIKLEKVLCEVEVDDSNKLTLKIISADMELELGELWYQNLSDKLANTLLDLLEKTIVNKIPPITISPNLLIANIDILGYTFSLDRLCIKTSKDQLHLSSDMIVNQLNNNSIPFPLYIGNKKSMKLHRFDCFVVEGIEFTHRTGYHGVYEAIRDGYRPCSECLRGYLELSK